MKKHNIFHIILSLGILSGACLAMPTAALAQDITTGLVGHWRLDETSGTTAADSAGSNSGTMNGGLDAGTDSVAGKVGTALNFDGADDYTEIASNPTLQINLPATVSGWVNLESATDEFVVFRSEDESGVESGFKCGTDNGTPRVIAVFGDGGTGGAANFRAKVASASGTLSLNQWHHVTCVIEGQTNMTLYLDGIEVGGSYTGSGGSLSHSGTDPSVIGRDIRSGSPYYAHGNVDDVRLYDRALTEEDVKHLYRSASGNMMFNSDNDTVQYFDDDEWIAAGPPKYKPNAVNFDGTNDWLSSSQTLTNSKILTASIWFRRNSSSAPGSTQRLLFKTGADFSIHLNSVGTLSIRGENSSNIGILIDGITSILDTNWHHLLLSVDMTDVNQGFVYLDDVDYSGSFTTYTDDTLNIGGSSTWGVGAISGSGNEKFDGNIADVWFDTNTHIDLSVEENRRAFIDANGNPVDLGSDGSNPTGTSPDIFLSGDTDDWHTNKGTGGGFTENGTLTTTPSPGDANKTWQQIGNSNDLGTAGSISVTALSNSTIAVQFGNTGLRTYSWDGTDWSQAGNSFVIPSSPVATMEAINNNTIVLTSGDHDQLYTYSWDGTDWSQVGNALALPNYSNQTGIALIDTNTIAYIDRSNRDLTTYSWDGTDWSQVGNALNISGVAAVQASPISTDTIAFIDSGNEDLRTYSWDGTDWSQVGNELNISGIGTPYLTAFGDNRIAFMGADIDLLQVYEWNGSDWQKTGTDLNLNPITDGEMVALDNNKVVVFEGTEDDLTTYGFAHCTTPSRPIGSIIYESANDQMQYCDGENWIPMGPPGNGGAGCTSPAGNAGDLVYNTSYNVMQYCEGDTYIPIGKSVDPCDGSPAPGTVCTDGTVYAGLSPDGSVPMFTTTADSPTTYRWNSGAIFPADVDTTMVNCSNTYPGVESSCQTGEANTAILASEDADVSTGGFQPHEAAQYCADLTANGHTDWYLPSQDELVIICGNRVAIGGFTTDYYWSSSENARDIGIEVAFPSCGIGVYSHSLKPNTYPVRCARK